MLKQSKFRVLLIGICWICLQHSAAAQSTLQKPSQGSVFAAQEWIVAVDAWQSEASASIVNGPAPRIPWRSSPDHFTLCRDYVFGLGSSYSTSHWAVALREQFLAAIVQDQGWHPIDWRVQYLHTPETAYWQRGLNAMLAQLPAESALLLAQSLSLDLPEQTQDLNEWLSFYHAIALQQSGEYVAAAAQLIQLIDTRTQVYSEQQVATLPVLPVVVLYDWLGHIQRANKDYAAAELSYRHALNAASLNPSDNDARLARAQRLDNLAELVQLRDRFYGAELLYRESLEIYLTVLGPWHQRSAQAMKQLASALEAQEQWAEALVFRQQAVILDEEIHGNNSPAVADSLAALAMLEHRQGQHQSALEHWQRALDIDRRALGDTHPKIILRLNHLARGLKSMNHLVEAEQTMEQVLELARGYFGTSHPATALAMSNLAGVLRAQDEMLRAEMLYRAAIQVDEQALGASHPTLASDFNNLAHLLHAMNRFAESEYYMRLSLEILYQDSQNHGLTHPYLAGMVENYSLILSEMGYNSQDIDRRLNFLMPLGLTLR